MDPSLWAALAGVGVGGVKSELFDRPRQENEDKYGAKMNFINMMLGKDHKELGPRVDTLGTMLQGGFAGANMGQNIQTNALDRKIAEAQAGKLDAETAALNRGQPLQGGVTYNTWSSMDPSQPPAGPVDYQEWMNRLMYGG